MLLILEPRITNFRSFPWDVVAVHLRRSYRSAELEPLLRGGRRKIS